MISISLNDLSQSVNDESVLIVDMRHERAQKKVSIPNSFCYVFNVTKEDIKKCTTPDLRSQLLSPKIDVLQNYLARHLVQKVLVISEVGGVREHALAHYLEQHSIDVFILEGGMQGVLKGIHSHNYAIPNLKVLVGLTGSGKSGQLELRAKAGEQVVSLHQLAQHRGSVFGGLSQCQPTNEQFQLDLFLLVQQFDLDKPVYVEWEPEHLGSITIPKGFTQCYDRGEVCWVDVPIQERVARLMSEYTSLSSEQLIDQFQFIAKRFSVSDQSIVLSSLANRNFESVLEILLPYFDEAYEAMYRKSGINRKESEKILITS
ncbi:MAG: hypothetical protein OCC49_15340 [Fibrobacterales bacterium]